MEPVAVAIERSPAASGAGLVRRAADGDVDAFEQLMDRGSHRTYRIARAILGNDEDAGDATQEAYVHAWRELPRLRDPERFNAWLRRIIVNSCRTRLRGRRYVREVSLERSVIDRASTDPGPVEHIGSADLLARAFDRLEADRRAILVLHYLAHEPVAAIADALGVPAGTVKWRLSEARAALARALAAEGEPRR